MSHINPLNKLFQGIGAALKTTIDDLEAHYSDLQKKEAGLCKSCGKEHALEKCGDMKPGAVKKGEKEMTIKAIPQKPEKGSVLPGDKKSKDLSDKDTGAGGQIKAMRKNAMKLSKATPDEMLAAFSQAQGNAAISKVMAPKPQAQAPGVQVSPNGGAACAHCQRFYPAEEQQGMAEARAKNCPCDANVAATLQQMRIQPMGKADVPMAKPPSGKVPGASAPSVSKPTAPSPMAKEEKPLAKAGPRLGGKDPLSQGMTNDAAKAAMPGAAPPKIPTVAPKLSQADQARRQAEMAAFTPAGAFGEQHNQGAVGGAMNPSQPSGLELAPKKPAAPAAGAPKPPKIPGRP